jgi:2-aminoethylphosphonate-pyruvate transaminase
MAKSKLLFTPGPLNTAERTKLAMMRDVGSRDREFLDIVRDIRTRLLTIGGCSPPDDYECILMQGSGTFAIESVISSSIVRSGRLLVLVNGAYGRRMVEMARIHGIAVDTVETPENRKIDPEQIAAQIIPGTTHLAVVHCETTTGIVNPIEEIGTLAAEEGLAYVVDAMSSFGAIPIDLKAIRADFLISSANKCVEGVPGFAFVMARREALQACKGNARTMSLDLFAQWAGLERDGQFRFTPPTHALLAFHQALLEHEAEGGVHGRATRYARNHQILTEGMAALGFEPYLDADDQSYIITTYRYPAVPEFSFEEFYSRLSELGFVIYPGKLSQEACFRIGTIGHLSAQDVERLLQGIENVMEQLTERSGQKV